MTNVAFYDAKPYDREYFLKTAPDTEITFAFHPFRLSAENAATASGCRAICVFVNDEVDRACLEGLAREGVGLIALRCAGFNHVDLKAAAALGIRVVRVPAYSPHAVAEHAVALLLTLNRKIHRAYNRVREHNFSLNGLVGFDLHGRTAGIIGTGKIGRITAEIFRGFGMEVLACDIYPEETWAAENRVRYCPFEEVLSRSDILSLHTPLTPGTHHLINRETISRMKDGFYLINTSRGKLIETTALIEALKRGKVGGVALDVYEIEEGVFFEDFSHDVLVDDDLARLIGFPNVLITSHQGFLTTEALAEIARVTKENIIAFAKGEALLGDTEVRFTP